MNAPTSRSRTAAASPGRSGRTVHAGHFFPDQQPEAPAEDAAASDAPDGSGTAQAPGTIPLFQPPEQVSPPPQERHENDHVDQRANDRHAAGRQSGNRRSPEESERRTKLGKFYYQPPSGESWSDVVLRVRALLTDVREAFDGGMSTEDAVAHGIKATAGVVTSAAVVMAIGTRA